VYLKDIGRIQGLLAVYFFVLLVQTLLERELRHAMAREKLESLPLYPEDRPCSRPTTYRVIEVFEPIRRHVLCIGDAEPQLLVTELTPPAPSNHPPPRPLTHQLRPLIRTPENPGEIRTTTCGMQATTVRATAFFNNGRGLPQDPRRSRRFPRRSRWIKK